MRRFLTQALASVGVLTALAVLDISPRASAAYVSTVSRSEGATVPASAPAEPPAAPEQAHRDPNRIPLLAYLPTDGGTTSNSTTGPSGPSSPVAQIPSKEPPSGNLVVYFREPAERLELRDFVDSILDPPRPV